MARLSLPKPVRLKRIARLKGGLLGAILADKLGLVGLCMLVTLASIAVLVPYLPLPDPYSLDFKRFLPPSWEHPFGTDHLGRDVFTRVLWGTRSSLLIGFTAAGISAVIGVVIGAVAGYYGGWVDEVLSRVIDIFLMIPVFFLVLYIVAVYGSNIMYVIAVIGLTTWPSTARIMRAQVLSLKSREFVQASILAGLSGPKILFKHVIPNGIQPIIANTILQAARAIIIEAALSYLGLGDPNVISWGRMIYEGQVYIRRYWWIPICPGIAIMVTVLALNLIGDAISHAIRAPTPGGGGAA